MTTILDELKQYGTIQTMDKEDNSYMIFTKEIYSVTRLLEDNKIAFTSEFDKQFSNYVVDFTL